MVKWSIIQFWYGSYSHTWNKVCHRKLSIWSAFIINLILFEFIQWINGRRWIWHNITRYSHFKFALQMRMCHYYTTSFVTLAQKFDWINSMWVNSFNFSNDVHRIEKKNRKKNRNENIQRFFTISKRFNR